MQQFNSAAVVFRSTRHAWVGLVCAIGIALTYKLNNFSISSLLNFDFGSQYLNYEFDRTLLRFLNSLLAVGVFFIVTTKKRSSLWKNTDRSNISLLLIYLLIFGVLKFVILGVPEFLSVREFMLEMYFNFFTGFSEEFLFRGLLFGGLCWFLSQFNSMLLSSTLFSLFHLRSNANVFDYVFWFVGGMLFCSLFSRRCGLVVLSIFHFLFDQVHYGFNWPSPIGNTYIITLIILVASTFLWLNFRNVSPKLADFH